MRSRRGGRPSAQKRDRQPYGTSGIRRLVDGTIKRQLALSEAAMRPARPGIPRRNLSAGTIIVCDVGLAITIGCVGLQEPSIL
jgi:hypothetical protein